MGEYGYKEVVAFKWSSEILDEGFVPLPKRLLRSLNRIFKGPLRVSEISTLLAIVDFARPQVTRKPSLAHLAGVAGLSEAKFRSCLRALRDRRLVDWSGTENAMEFDYSGFKRKVMRLTRSVDKK